MENNDLTRNSSPLVATAALVIVILATTVAGLYFYGESLSRNTTSEVVDESIVEDSSTESDTLEAITNDLETMEDFSDFGAELEAELDAEFE